MANKKRPVEWIVMNKKPGLTHLKKNGLFHRFADSPTFGDKGNVLGVHTVAIVEKEDGTIVELLPREIRFTDK